MGTVDGWMLWDGADLDHSMRPYALLTAMARLGRRTRSGWAAVR